jgi:hypothetical protein
VRDWVSGYGQTIGLNGEANLASAVDGAEPGIRAGVVTGLVGPGADPWVTTTLTP